MFQTKRTGYGTSATERIYGIGIVILIKRIALLMLLAFVLAVFGTFAYNLYHRHAGGSEHPPGIIFERSDRPARV